MYIGTAVVRRPRQLEVTWFRFCHIFSGLPQAGVPALSEMCVICITALLDFAMKLS